MPGAEPFTFAGSGEIGVLLIHGFTGSPAEMKPLGAHLASLGISSTGVLLSNHGTHPADLLGCRYQCWMADAEAGLEDLLAANRRVFLAGLSMGGTIALNIAARRADDPRIAGLIALCAPLQLVDWRLGLLPILAHLIRWQAWGKPDIKDQSAWDRHVGYRRFRPASLVPLLRLMSDTRPLLPMIRQPLLIVQAREDNTIPPTNAELIASEVGSRDKRIVWLDNCYHVVTLDYAAPTVNAEVARFIAERAAGA